MSNGKHVEVESDNAADAIQEALQSNPWSTVKECYSGSKTGKGTHSGFIEYEIPKHKALTDYQAEALCDDVEAVGDYD